MINELMSDSLTILFLGDIVGRPGRQAIREFLPLIKRENLLSMVIGNAENAAGGFGLTSPIVDELVDLGLDVLTSGNHIWDKKEMVEEIEDRPYLLRPANYPEGAPGRGIYLAPTADGKVGIINLSGRVFMGHMDCPFRMADKLVAKARETTPIIVVDMHAEATSEKQALAWYLDGKVSAVIGTHTHVQTNDARILPKGTAFISDAGMTGPSESIIGVKKDLVISRFLLQIPRRFETARRFPQLEGVLLDIDRKSGKALGIRNLRCGGYLPENIT